MIPTCGVSQSNRANRAALSLSNVLASSLELHRESGAANGNSEMQHCHKV